VRPDLRAAAFEALAHVGLDERAALHAIDGLEDADVRVRAMAAQSLQGWLGVGNAASRLGKHLDDAWPVAVHAARALRSLGERGALELQAAVALITAASSTSCCRPAGWRGFRSSSTCAASCSSASPARR
jgi:HEAT repeat protein